MGPYRETRNAACVLIAVILWCVTGFAGAEFVTVDERLGLPRSMGGPSSVTSALVALGRTMFSDPRLSRDGTVACINCHDPARAFTDARPTSVGLGGAAGTRNAPSLINVEYSTRLLWDGRRATLEAQAGAPFVNSREHGFTDDSELVRSIIALDDYRAAVDAAIGRSRQLTPSDIERALAAFMRTLTVGDSPFDRYFYAGDKSALSERARRGLELFRGAAGCAQCHTIGDDSALFTDGDYHGVAIGTARVSDLSGTTRRAVSLHPDRIDEAIALDPDIAALGRFVITRDARDIGKYRTPSLRNVGMTAPYMHDGSVDTLARAVDMELYYRGTRQGRPPVLTVTQREDLVSFLESLTSDCVKRMTCSFFR